MIKRLSGFTRELRLKIHLLALGMTLGVGATFLNQGCVASGQCATCGNCASRLPLLAVPLLVNGLVMLVGKVWDNVQRRDPLPAHQEGLGEMGCPEVKP